MFEFKTKNRYDQQSVGGAQPTPAGFYPAKILEVEPMRSKSGRDMLKLTIEIDAGGVRCIKVKDYLILHSDFAWKIEQYLAAIGVQFKEKENISIDTRTFLGGKFVALTCNEPGQSNTGRLYVKVLHALRQQAVPYMGALRMEELEYYGLASDGVRKGETERKIVAQQQAPQNSMWQNNNSMGRQPREQYSAHPGHQHPQQATVPGLPPVDNMADDDIPF